MKIKAKVLLSIVLSISFIASSLPIYALEENTTSTKGTEIVNEVVQGETKDETKEETKAEIKDEISVKRISGNDRYETAVKISEYVAEITNNYSKISVLASGESYPDALSAGLLASELKAPLLFVSKNNVPSCNNEVMVMQNKTFVVGGPSTVNNKVLKELPRAFRLSGDDRLETAEEVNYAIRDYRYALNKEIRQYTDEAAVYNGYNYPDALTATPYMYQYNKDKTTLLMLLPYIKNDLSYMGKSSIIFGGENSVPQLGEDLRISGSDRYKTAVAIAKSYKTNLNMDIDTVVITSGESYPDALAATPLASQLNAAILLTGSKNLNADTKEFLETNKQIKKVIIVGGESSISNDVEKELKEIK